MDCGLACLKMVCQYYGKHLSAERIRELASYDVTGVTMKGISDAAISLGFGSEGIDLRPDQWQYIKGDLPAILFLKKGHFVVVYKVGKSTVTIADPAIGKRKVPKRKITEWCADKTGIKILLLSPTDLFFSQPESPKSTFLRTQVLKRRNTKILLYLGPTVLLILLLLLIQFLIPFLSKLVFDIGIPQKDIAFVKLFLFAQLFLIVIKNGVEVLKSRINLYLSSRINFDLLNNFLAQLSVLPIRFFETRKMGDILQRIGDHGRIEAFFTRVIINVFFALLQAVVYSFLLYYFNPVFLVFFAIAATVYLLWFCIFLRPQADRDRDRFEIQSANQSLLLQYIQGIVDLKISNAGAVFRNKWINLQRDSLGNNFKAFDLEQIKNAGSTLIYQSFQLTLTYYSVYLVINDGLSLGGLLTLQFIVSQLIAPIDTIINAVFTTQMAKLSLDRLSEIWELKTEDMADKLSGNFNNPAIEINNLSFSYSKSGKDAGLKNIDLSIPGGSVTAIVGLSGSGKTTLLKLILGFYQDYKGNVTINGKNLREINVTKWRNVCGLVSAESFIFNETISFNVSMQETCDEERVCAALRDANILDFVESLPMGIDTKIGAEGKGVSQGQRQRLLIARAMYKNPEVFILDESTNALDAENETIIMRNLKNKFRDKTVIIAAHRLSTIRHADKIIVLQDGEIKEMGRHEKLIEARGKYFKLLRDQSLTS